MAGKGKKKVKTGGFTRVKGYVQPAIKGGKQPSNVSENAPRQKQLDQQIDDALKGIQRRR